MQAKKSGAHASSTDNKCLSPSHPIAFEIIESGPKWQTTQQTEQHCHPENQSSPSEKEMIAAVS